MRYLDFKTARCKDCFKCLRACPVKAIKIENHQAKILEDKCILCGKCTSVCPQNAKQVHSELDTVKALVASGEKVIASVAPSFVSSFGVQDFSVVKLALGKLGFFDAEETAVGANVVTEEYSKLLRQGGYKNFITSACPAINRMIQIYYPKVLKYLAPVASPMVAHARMLKERYSDAKIVFFGPCIAKKREAEESGIIADALTFEELKHWLDEAGIALNNIARVHVIGDNNENRAKYYPISRGIIKSFVELPEGYEYVAVDGLNRSFDVLEDIDSLSDMFIEINCCEYACINGPCALEKAGGALKANEEIRQYVKKELGGGYGEKIKSGIDVSYAHPRLQFNQIIPGERDIRAILARIGKVNPEEELNCGACGYSTCRDKAIAVANGYADIDMCIPYMRGRAESMSYEIIQNSPNGIIVLDNDLKILEVNNIARQIFGIGDTFAKGKYAFECFPADEFISALSDGKNVNNKKVYFSHTDQYAELSVILLKEHKVMFGVIKNITDRVEYENKLDKVRLETLATTDEVIRKQMMVAQEIASLLGETTAETKVALLKLKKTLTSDGDKKQR